MKIHLFGTLDVNYELEVGLSKRIRRHRHLSFDGTVHLRHVVLALCYKFKVPLKDVSTKFTIKPVVLTFRTYFTCLPLWATDQASNATWILSTTSFPVLPIFSKNNVV